MSGKRGGSFIFVAVLFFLVVGITPAVYAYTIDIESLNIVNGTVPGPYTLGTYMYGSSGLSGTSPPDSYSWSGDPTFDPAAGNDTDWHWVQATTNLVVWDLGTLSDTVYVFPSIDHGPSIYESLEFTVFGVPSDPTSPLWIPADLQTVYADGWIDYGTPVESDDWASEWVFPVEVRYIGIYANYSMTIFEDAGHTTWNSLYDSDPTTPGWQSFDAEIDAVGVPVTTTVPEPSTILLVGVGSAGIVWLRRKRTF